VGEGDVWRSEPFGLLSSQLAWSQGRRLLGSETLVMAEQSRRKNPRGGGLTFLRGLMLRMEKKNFSSFFNVFKISVKIFVHKRVASQLYLGLKYTVRPRGRAVEG